jgi:DNA-binding transcriptional ArsR family regulator
MDGEADRAAGTFLPDITSLSHTTSDSLRALSNEHRLLIMALLAGTERSVAELENLLRLPQPAVSQQLARLRLDGLVNCRRDGRTMYYSVVTERLAKIIADLDQLLDLRALIQHAGETKAAPADVEHHRASTGL